MGYELYRHVLNNAPDEIDATARLVLAVIADDANEKTRTSYMGIELLAHRTGLSSHGITKALRRLANAGIEIRVPIGMDGRGRPVFAVKGRRTTYLIPVFPERTFMDPKVAPQGDHTADESSPQEATNDHAKVAPQAPKVAPQGDPPPQSPQSPHSFGPTNDSSLFPRLDEEKKAAETKKTEEKTTAPKPPKTKPTPAPDHLTITDQMRAWAKKNVPDIDIEFETAQFLDRHAAKGNTFVDWTRAWHTWMRNARKYAEERQQGRLRVVNGHGGARQEVPTHEDHNQGKVKVNW